MTEYAEIDSVRVRRLVNDADGLLRKAAELLETDGPHIKVRPCVEYARSDLHAITGKIMDVLADLDIYDTGTEPETLP